MATIISGRDLDAHTFRNQGDARNVWDACQGPIYRVVDECGVNVENAVVRHLLSSYWLYADDVDGYLILEDADVQQLTLIPEEAWHGPQS